MPIYELWRARGGTEYSMFPPDGKDEAEVYKFLTTEVNGRPMVLVASFWAQNWNAAKLAQRAILDW